MLKYRLIFGPIMIAAFFGILVADSYLDEIDLTGTWAQKIMMGRTYLPSGLLVLLLIWLLIVTGGRELCRMFRAKHIPVSNVMIMTAGILGCSLIYVIPYRIDSQSALAMVMTLFVAVFIAALVRHAFLKKKTEGAIMVGAATAFALIYMGMMPGFYLAIRRWYSPWVIVAIIMVTKSCDIGAYFTGRAIGKHKLIPWLSPGKTWEGLVGGVLFSATVCLGVATLFNYLQSNAGMHIAGYWQPHEDGRTFVVQPFPLLACAVAGALLGLVGQFGDLTASLFKRDAGIKDSGNTIPGFGGVIDVVDSPIVVAPLAYWMLILLKTAG